jgi:hypothetical protein
MGIARALALPSKEVFAPAADEAIRLITRTGQLDRSRRSYVHSFIGWGCATAS